MKPDTRLPETSPRDNQPPAAHVAHDPDEAGLPPAPPKLRAGTIGLVSIGFIAVLGGLFAAGLMPKLRRSAALETQVRKVQTSLPRVRTELPRVSQRLVESLLPGDLEAAQETAIYARTTGYVRKLNVDIGAIVKAGDTLVTLDTPEIDAQVKQAQAALLESRASLESAKATVKLSGITVNRLRGLTQNRAVSQQELDEAEGALEVARARVKVAEATIEANQASLKRIEELQSFATITAPFDGTITERSAEIGQLVSSSGGAPQSLFRLAKTDPVRVFVDVPQVYASGVATDLEAEVLVREIPGRKFVGKVVRTARAIDPRTRTLRTEIQVPNEDHALLTGSYVQVRLSLERSNPPLMVPASSLIINAQGMFVAVVDNEKLIQLRPVKVEGDQGSAIAISSGISADELVVVNPGDRLEQNMAVEVEASPKAASVAAESPKLPSTGKNAATETASPKHSAVKNPVAENRAAASGS